MGAFSDLLERSTSGGQQTDDKYFRMPTPEWTPRGGQSVQSVVRILDERPVKVYRHWFQNAEGRNVPLNCPGRKDCPACSARNRAYREGDPSWKDLYRSDTKYLFNVATEVDGKLQVRIWSIGRKQLGDVDFWTARKGYENVRAYDFEVSKNRTGPAQMNIEYKFFASPPTGFTEEYEALLDLRFDLAEEIAPASIEDINRAMAEQVGLQVGPTNGFMKGATLEQIAELTALAEAQEHTLETLGVNVGTLTYDQAVKFLDDLKS